MGVKKDGEAKLYPGREYILKSGDYVFILATDEKAVNEALVQEEAIMKRIKSKLLRSLTERNNEKGNEVG